MPYKEFEVKKIYFSIGEVAKMFGVSPSKIRFWEGEFDDLRPKKNRKGNRRFTREDIEILELIFHLVEEKGFTLEGAKKQLKDKKQDLLSKNEAVRSLKKIREFLHQLKDHI